MINEYNNNLFIGREEEKRRIEEYLNSNRNEFVAIYGRRVGKTYLVRNTLKIILTFILLVYI